MANVNFSGAKAIGVVVSRPISTKLHSNEILLGEARVLNENHFSLVFGMRINVYMFESLP